MAALASQRDRASSAKSGYNRDSIRWRAFGSAKPAFRAAISAVRPFGKVRPFGPTLRFAPFRLPSSASTAFTFENEADLRVASPAIRDEILRVRVLFEAVDVPNL